MGRGRFLLRREPRFSERSRKIPPRTRPSSAAGSVFEGSVSEQHAVVVHRRAEAGEQILNRHVRTLLAAQSYHAARGGFDPFFAIGSVSRLARGYAALGMVVSIANPLPMYAMQNRMSPRGTVICAAFAADVMCTLGDHLGYISAVAPEAITPMLAGRVLASAAAIAFALLFERLSPSEPA